MMGRRGGHDDLGGSQGAWQRLSSGRTIGKRTNLLVPATRDALDEINYTNAFQIQGTDDDAQPLNVLISPPRLVPTLLTLEQQHNATGTIDNQDNLNPNIPDIGWGRPVCVLEWGIGGISNRCEIDALNGINVNISASWVRIGAFLERPNVTSLFVYEFSAFIGPGMSGSSSGQRTIQAEDATAVNVETPVRAVPKFAKTVSVVGTNGAKDISNVDIIFYCNKAATVPKARYSFNNNLFPLVPVPIPSAAPFFTLITPMVGGSRLQALFQLDI